MTPDPISFARGCGTKGPCAQFVVQWLFIHGLSGGPSTREIYRDWRRLGVEAGVSSWCEKLGLTPCAPQPHAIALARQPQDAEDPLLGILTEDGLFVTRSFAKVLIVRDVDIVKAWRV
ncbi:hypothetical protein [Methylocystis echinoides]|uniref:hypothetical protein n=1 Tax=Methylocystis echinoides TaxID=29468 RepID=UPI00341294DE